MKRTPAARDRTGPGLATGKVPGAALVFCVNCTLALTPQPACAHSRGSDAGFVDPTFIWWILGLLVLFEVAFMAFVVRRRRRRGDGSRGKSTPTAGGSKWIERLWVVVPLVLVVAMFLAATLGIPADPGGEQASPGSLVLNGATPRGALEVDVAARQFQWDFRYPSEGLESRTDLHIPVGRDVVLALESKDVVHSFDIPSLGLRHDLLPGRKSTLSFRVNRAGRYPIVCSALCGSSADREMPGMLMVDEAAAFQEWVARTKRGTP